MPGTLILSIEPSWPPVSGGDLRRWSIATAAAKLGPVRLLSVMPPGDAISPDPRITLGALSDWTARRIFRRPRGGSAVDLTLPALEVPLATAVAAMRPANIVIEELPLHPLLSHLAGIEARLVIDLHNIDSDLVAQRLSSWRLLGLGALQARGVRAIERSVVRTADEVWTCSAVDAKRIVEIAGPGFRPRIVPNGIPQPERVPRVLAPRAPRGNGPKLLFAGHLRYRPNVIAAKILARSILPAVRSRLPGAKLIIAGRNPRASVDALAGDAVEVRADPPDIGAILAEVDFAVVPLTMGSGTRIKIVEAMAWGVPVIATRKAAEGLDLADGVDIRLAEQASEFAAAIEALWRDASAYERQRAEGHRVAFERFGPAAIERAVAAGLRSSHRGGTGIPEPALAV